MLSEPTCEICGLPVHDDELSVDDFFGGTAHADCLQVVAADEEDDRDD